MRRAFLLIPVLMLAVPFAAGAQSFGGIGGVSGDAFTLSVNPQYPSPYGHANVSVTSDSITLTNAMLTVYVNGTQTYAGTVRTFPVDLGAAGAVTSVHAIISASGRDYEKTIFIQPQDVVLIAEPVASVPPLYPGKASVPLGGNVRVVALANLKDAQGRPTSPLTSSYVWTVDGIEMLDSSGIGKSSIIVPSPFRYRANDVSVVVSDASGKVVSGATLSLSADDPVVRVYENDPLLGIRYEHALTQSYSIQGAEATLYAAPFSLPISSGAPSLQWFLNGTRVETGNSITLRPQGGGEGNANISLTASSAGNATANTSLSVIFGSKKTNVFGL